MNQKKIDIDYPLQLLNDRYEEIILALELCKNRNLVLPTLMILFSAIESAAFLNSDNKSSKKRFIEWTERYLINEKTTFTSMDLYSSRCGILHSLTSNSSLVKEKKAKKGIYSFGETKYEEIVKVLGVHILDECFIIKLDDLLEIFYKGFLEFFDNILKDKRLKKSVLQKCSNYYSHTTIDDVAKKYGVSIL